MLKRLNKITLFLIILIAIGYFSGPKISVQQWPIVAAIPPLNGLEEYLRTSEQRYTGISPGAEKEIIWSGQNKQQSCLALVYLHGFSATKEEIRPVPDWVAQALNAHLFYTRFNGHGLPGEAMGQATINDWLYDVLEAIAIGKRLGQKVVLMGTSTGATFATLAAMQPELKQNIAGLVLVSPNYGIQTTGLGLLAGHWGYALAPILAGEVISFTAKSKAHAKWWTLTYPSTALVPMAVAVDMVNNGPVEDIKIPALFIYSPADQVVDPNQTEAIIARWTGAKKVVQITDAQDSGQHVIAGRIRSPNTSQKIANIITNWLRSTMTKC